MTIEFLIPTIAAIILGVLYVAKTWKSQSSEIDSSTIASLKRQMEAYTSEVEGYKKQVHELTFKAGEQEATIKILKETIEKYEKILQNRNPELTQLLIEIRDFMKSSKKELVFQTDLLKKAESRDSKLDKTHAEIQKTS